MLGRGLVSGAVALAGGCIIGRVRLQKVMYLLSCKGLGGPFRFSYHHYGPFSRSVDEAISEAKAFCGLNERIEHRILDGAPFSVFELDASSSGFTANSLGGLSLEIAREDILRMISVTSTVIEVAATIYWLKHEEVVSDWRSELAVRKGAKASSARIEQALNLLATLGLEPERKPALSDFLLGDKVLHDKFGKGVVVLVDGNKLTVDFEHAGRKMVLESFVSAA